jgi:hypothetical protein
MLEVTETYPINEGVSGYWDTLSPSDLAEFDTALDFAQVYISASRSSQSDLGREISKPVGRQLASEALLCLCIRMPDPWIFDSSIPLVPLERLWNL